MNQIPNRGRITRVEIETYTHTHETLDLVRVEPSWLVNKPN
jgi:hypothetical protein